MAANRKLLCGAVYVNIEYTYTLKCSLCSCVLRNLMSFAIHMRKHHQNDLEQILTLNEKKEANIKAERGTKAYTEPIHALNEKEEEQDVHIKLEEESEDATEINGDADDTDQDLKECPPVVNFEVEIMPFDFKPEDYSNSETSNVCSSNENEHRSESKEKDHFEYSSRNKERNSQLDALDSDYDDSQLEPTKMEKRGKRKRKQQSQSSYGSEEEKDDDLNKLNYKSEIELSPSEAGNEEEFTRKTEKKLDNRRTNAPFFHMRFTESEIMLDFIEIIRQHPCHWNTNHLDYNSKDARDESAEQICKQLAELHNINITPQVARTSVLFLCRWYEREYFRTTSDADAFTKVRSKKRRDHGPACTHPDYYAALHAFLPSHHLKVVTCTQCPRKFKSESYLLTHIHAAHNGAIPFKCRHCPRGFAHVSSLRYHENRHTKAKTWPCELCTYRGVTSTDFQQHMTTHTNTRAFVCEVCGAAYKSNTSLNVHKRTHAPPRLSCVICGKMFRENYRLKRHIWLHESDDGDDVKVTPQQLSFKCDNCNRRFASAATLQQHRKITHGMKTTKMSTKKLKRDPSSADEEDQIDFSCTTCEVDFINLNELRAHSLKMHDIVIS